MSDDLESKARQKLRETSENGHDDAAELYAKSAAAASDGDDDVAQTYYEAAEEENPDVGGGGGGGIVGTIVGLALLAFSAGLLLTMVSVGLASAVVGAFAAVWWFISFGILFPEQAPIGTAYWEALRNVHYIVGLFGTVWLLDRTARRLLVGYLSRIPIVGRGIPSLLRLARTAPLPVSDRPTLGDLYDGRIGVWDGAMAGAVAGLSVSSFAVFYLALVAGQSIAPDAAQQTVGTAAAAGSAAGAVLGGLVPSRWVGETKLLPVWRSLLLSPLTLGAISLYANSVIEPVAQQPFAVGSGGVVTAVVAMVAVGAYGAVQLPLGESFVRLGRDGVAVLVLAFRSIPDSIVTIGIVIAIVATVAALTADLRLRYRDRDATGGSDRDRSGEQTGSRLRYQGHDTTESGDPDGSGEPAGSRGSDRPGTLLEYLA